LTYRVVSAQPSFADVNISGTTLTITLKADQFGTADIEVEVDDGNKTDSKTFSLTVNSVNDAPVAVDDTASASTAIAKIIHVLSNDTDIDGPDSLTISSISAITNGEAILIENNTSIEYTSSEGFTGEVNLTYEITDGDLTAEANVTITVSDTVEYSITDLIGKNLSEVEYDDGDDDGEDPEGAEMEPTGDDCEGDDCEDNDGTLIHWNFDSGTLDMRYWMLAKDHSNDEKYKFDILDESLDYTSSVDEILALCFTQCLYDRLLFRN